MRALILSVCAVFVQGCGGTCGQDPPEFIFADEVSPIGIVPADAIAELPTTFVLPGTQHTGGSGEVQFTVRSRPGDPVFINAWHSGKAATEWCPTSKLRLPVAIDINPWLEGSFTLAGHKFVGESFTDWEPMLQAWTVIDVQGFGLPYDEDGALEEGSFIWASFEQTSQRQWVEAWVESPEFSEALFRVDVSTDGDAP